MTINKPYSKPIPFTILMADDDDDDILLTQDAMLQGGVKHDLQVVRDGQELLDYLGSLPDTERLPNIIFLDLNMPVMDGRNVLKALKKQDKLKKIPVIILSTSNNEVDINECYKLGASGYITKPKSFDQLVEIMNTINQYWYQTASLPGSE